MTRWTPACKCSTVAHPLQSSTPRTNTLTRRSEQRNLKTLSDLGHFLKGSSATLGLTKVKDSCEKIQHYGQKKDDTGTKDISEEEGLSKLRTTIEQAKEEFHDVEKVLRKFYND